MVFVDGMEIWLILCPFRAESHFLEFLFQQSKLVLEFVRALHNFLLEGVDLMFDYLAGVLGRAHSELTAHPDFFKQLVELFSVKILGEAMDKVVVGGHSEAGMDLGEDEMDLLF